MVAQIFFWGAVALIGYTYGIFPLWVMLRGWLRPKPYKPADIAPRVSLIIAAYNEEQDIGQKIENILSLEYPHDQLDVVIASDGSIDRTNEIVERYAAKSVRLLTLPRVGKAKALNEAVATATGEILVFSDANSQFAPDALHQLVRPFADPEVGGVAGDQRYLKRGSNLSGSGERRYWDFDRLLKSYESKGGNTISATGAIYAIRRELFVEVPEGVTDDFVTSTRVIAQGKRLVFADDAAAYEPVSQTMGVEYGRKVRVMTRGLNSIIVMRELLNPIHHGFYAIQLFSHKVLRRLLFIPMVVLIIVTPFLWKHGLLYQLAMVGQVAFYGLAAVGSLIERRGVRGSRFLAIPFYMTMVYAAAAAATWNVLRGRRIARWEPQRQAKV